MNATQLLDQFVAPLLLGGPPRLDLPLGEDAFAALIAEPPPAAPAIADALTAGTRAIWAAAPAATVDTDVLYTAAMLHDLLGVLHPVFVRSIVAQVIGLRIEARLDARRRRLSNPLVALRRHVLADAALRSIRQDEHVELEVFGKISAYGRPLEYARLPWRVEAARTTTQLSAREALTDTRWAVLERLSPLTAFTIGVQEGTALPWIRWLTTAAPVLRFVVHTLRDARSGPDALMATLARLDSRRPDDARWWLGLALLVGERNPHAPDDFRALVETLRPYGHLLGAPAARQSRASGPLCRTTRTALRAARLEN